MGTPAAFEAAANAQIISDTSATVTTNVLLGFDFSIASGVTLVRGTATVVGERPFSNENYQLVHYLVEMIHQLADPTDVDAYLHGAAQLDQIVLMSPGFWRDDVAGVFDMEENPEISLPIDREGNVIIYNVSVIVALSP